MKCSNFLLRIELESKFGGIFGKDILNYRWLYVHFHIVKTLSTLFFNFISIFNLFSFNFFGFCSKLDTKLLIIIFITFFLFLDILTNVKNINISETNKILIFIKIFFRDLKKMSYVTFCDGLHIYIYKGYPSHHYVRVWIK